MKSLLVLLALLKLWTALGMLLLAYGADDTTRDVGLAVGLGGVFAITVTLLVMLGDAARALWRRMR